VMLLGTLPAGNTAQAAPLNANATSTPTITATPTAPSPVWTVVDPVSKNTLWLDPFSQQFQFRPAGDTPVPGTDRNMKYTRQRVTWKWSDPLHACDSNAPASRANTCPVYVWGSIDRVRHVITVTLYKRDARGKATTKEIDVRTPLPLPMPTEPAVEIQDGGFVPKVKILLDTTDRLTFQNNTQRDCKIVLSRPPRQKDANNGNRDLVQTIDVRRGKASTPFPVLVATPSVAPGQPTLTPQAVWQPGNYTYTCLGRDNVGGEIRVRE
jgi:hypothetical protein